VSLIIVELHPLLQVSELKKKQEAQAQLLRQKQKSEEAAKRLQDEIQRIKSQKVSWRLGVQWAGIFVSAKFMLYKLPFSMLGNLHRFNCKTRLSRSQSNLGCGRHLGRKKCFRLR